MYIYIYLLTLFVTLVTKSREPLSTSANPRLRFLLCEELCGQELASPTVSKVHHVRPSVLTFIGPKHRATFTTKRRYDGCLESISTRGLR